MKNLNYTFGLLLIAVLTISFQSCQSPIKFNSAEQEADSLAIQMKRHNERVKDEWVKTISLYNQRNAFAEELIIMINKITNGTTAETKELSTSLEKFKTINQSDDLLLNEELFDALTIQLEDIQQKISNVLVMAKTREIKNSSFFEIQTNLERIENRISVQRRIFNNEARSYNSKIKNDANKKFYEKYPNLGIKCYFKPKEGTDKAPEVQF